MAAGDLVQSAQNTGSSGASTTPTLGAGATAGNLLVMVSVRSATATTLGAPGGMTLLHKSTEGVGPGMVGGVWWAIAAGSETGFTFAGGSAESGNWRTGLYEFEGPFDASPLEGSDDDLTNVATVVTSQAAGSVTTTVADALAIAFVGFDSANNAIDGRGWDDSFAEVDFGSEATAAARAGFSVATRVLSATATVAPTFSTTDTGDEMYGALGVFNFDAGGGTTYPSTVSGTLTVAGVIVRQTQTAKTGAVTSAGALVRETRRALVGALTSAGALTAVKTALVALTGTLSSAGALSRQTARALTGTSSSAGALLKQTARALVGAVASAGALAAVKTALVSLTGTLASAGALAKQTGKGASGVLAPAGAIARLVAVSTAGTLSTVGGLVKATRKGLSGAVTIAGALSAVSAVISTFRSLLFTDESVSASGFTNEAMARSVEWTNEDLSEPGFTSESLITEL